MLRPVHTVSRSFTYQSPTTIVPVFGRTVVKVHSPKVRPQIHNLPGAQPNQHAHRPKRKPLNPFIRALVGISQLLLPHPEILHLLHDLINRLLDPSQFRLDGLELLVGLDGGPVARVGADVDVKLDMAGWGVAAVF